VAALPDGVMSGIAGLLRFQGQAVEPRDLERMANALRPHGPDRSHVVVNNHVGLANVLMRITPEDRFDRQPLVGSSEAVITADVRLDNRQDLLARMGAKQHDAATWPDSQVLLKAWERFGDNVWPILRGPFAAAIWDTSRQILTLARDHLGLNVVVWHRSEQFFAFASMPKGLFAIPEVPRELNEEKFADFLVLNHADHETTHYRNIFRVPPAHFVKVTASGSTEQRRYWSTADIKTVRLHSDQAYAEGLRECLDRSVRRQMRSAHAIGCHLSGGLDSSSVSVLAARALGEKNKRLSAFTHVPRLGFNEPVIDGCYADETLFVEAIRNFVGNIDVTYVRDHAGDAKLEEFFPAYDGPVRNPTALDGMLSIQHNARAQGRRVLLSGFFGNNTISWNGWSQAADHVRSGRLITAYRQWRLFYRRSTYSQWRAFYKLIVEPLLPSKVAQFSFRGRREALWHNHAAIRSDYAIAMGVEARAENVGHDFLYRMRRGERTAGLTPVDYIGDWFAAEKAITGVETRDPTADIDVVSFCFGVPPEQYLVENIDRSLIRRAMWGLLPEIVLANRLSGLQAADWHEKLENRHAQIAAELAELAASPLANRAIDFARLDKAMKNWPTCAWHTREVTDEYQFALARGIASARFLRWMESANDRQRAA